MDKVLEKWNLDLQGLHTKAGDFAIHLSSRVRETGDRGPWSKQAVGLDKSASSGKAVEEDTHCQTLTFTDMHTHICALTQVHPHTWECAYIYAPTLQTIPHSSKFLLKMSFELLYFFFYLRILL